MLHDDDQKIRVTRVPALLGQRCAPSTPIRWVKRGVLVRGKRVYLEAERIGGVWYTTPAAVNDFRRRLQQAAPAPLSDRPAARRSRSENAARELEAELRN